MKNIFLIWIIFYASLTQAAPPTSIGSEAGSKSFTQNLVLPNNQVTKLSGINSRLETGNANLLANPSFEHATFNTSWTATLGTASPETSNKTDGNQALKITSSGAGVNLYQASTINAASLKGQQMVMRVAINSTDPLLKACSRVDGVDTDCVTVPITDTNTPFKTIEIPFIAGGVSNGITIKSATTTTQNIYVDEAVVAKSSPFHLPPRMTTAQMNAISSPANGLTIYNTDYNSLASYNSTSAVWTYGFGNLNNGARLMGTVKVTGCATLWSTSSASYASLGAQTGCVYTLSGDALQPSTNIPAFKFASLPAGDYRIEYEGSIGPNTISTQNWFQFTDGTNTAREESYFYGYGSTPNIPGISQTISYSSPQTNVTFELKARTNAASATVYGSTTNPGVFRLYYFPKDPNVNAWVQANSNPIATTTEFTAQSDISAGVSRLNSTGWVSNGSIAGALYNFPITGFTIAPNCWANSSQIGAGSVRIVNVTSTSSVLTVEVTNNSGATATTTITFGCQKSGADYTAAHSPFIIGTFAGYTADSNIPTASYWVSANFTASASIPINFDSKEWDSHNAVTTSATAWKFTAPVSGVYSVSGFIAGNVPAVHYFKIYKNGSAYKAMAALGASWNSSAFSTSVRLNQGDYIDIRPPSANNVSGAALNANLAMTNIVITKTVTY